MVSVLSSIYHQMLLQLFQTHKNLKVCFIKVTNILLMFVFCLMEMCWIQALSLLCLTCSIIEYNLTLPLTFSASEWSRMASHSITWPSIMLPVLLLCVLHTRHHQPWPPASSSPLHNDILCVSSSSPSPSTGPSTRLYWNLDWGWF